MKQNFPIWALACLLLLVGLALALALAQETTPVAEVQQGQLIALPVPDTQGTMPLETALMKRRSVRAYSDQGLTLSQVGQLVWAAQGITEPNRGLRTAPSAIAMYPLKVYVIVKTAEELAPGVWRYVPASHSLERVRGALSTEETARALPQGAMKQAPVVVAITGDLSIIGQRVPDRALEWTAIEVGHVAQNVLLEAVALGLASVPTAGFDPAAVLATLGLAAPEQLFYLLPVGYQKQ